MQGFPSKLCCLQPSFIDPDVWRKCPNFMIVSTLDILAQGVLKPLYSPSDNCV